MYKILEIKSSIKSMLPKKGRNSTDNSPNPSVYRMYLLQWSVHKCIENKIRGSKTSCKHICLKTLSQKLLLAPNSGYM